MEPGYKHATNVTIKKYRSVREHHEFETLVMPNWEQGKYRGFHGKRFFTVAWLDIFNEYIKANLRARVAMNNDGSQLAQIGQAAALINHTAVTNVVPAAGQ